MNRKEYIDKLEGQLRRWDAEIDMWEAKAENTKADLQMEIDKTVKKPAGKKKRNPGEIR